MTSHDRHLDEQIIADLRRTHAQLKANQGAIPKAVKSTSWSMRLTLEEVDAILRLHDEVVELRKQTVGDWEPDFPPVRVTTAAWMLAEEQAAEDEEYDAKAREAFRSAPHAINSCPHAGTHHNCPLGGCPTFERRDVTIPDVPRCEHRVYGRDAGRCARRSGHDGSHLIEAPSGREARETPMPVMHCLSTVEHLPHVWRVHRKGATESVSVQCLGFRSGDPKPIA